MSNKMNLIKNKRCFIRKDHDCGRYIGASKMCFIACPDPKEVGLELAIISEKLQKEGLDPFIAIRERVYGEDIFCTKICGRIIESMLCIVLLNDVKSKKSDDLIPNPNVYYEYGLMTALKKEIIPLQHSEHKLAFNIQSLETIKYTNENLADELEKAIKKTLAIIELSRESEQVEIESDLITRKIFWMLESKGLNRQTKFTRDSILEASSNTIFLNYKDSEDYPIFVVIAKNNEMALDIVGGIKVISSRIEKIKYRTEVEISNFEIESDMKGQYTIAGHMYSRKRSIDYKRFSEFSDQMKKIERISILVLATEGFSDINKIKSAHGSIKFKSKPKLEIWDQQQITQSIIDEGLEFN